MSLFDPRSGTTHVFDTLEDRRLFAFTAAVNFQPAGVPIPAGYVADTGAVFGNRGNGLTYGWNAINANGLDRNAAISPDQRYDTFNRLQAPNSGNTWEIAVPNGTYQVKLVAGDAWVGGVYKIDVENVRTIDGVQTQASPWLTGTKTVTVTDGKLTVKAGSGASGAKVNFIEIAEQVATPTPGVTGVTLINAATDQDIGLLTNGMTINQAVLGTEFNVRAALAGVASGSLRFDLDGVYTRTENFAPFSLFGDGAGPDYFSGDLSLGSHQLIITPTSGADGTGTVGTPVTINFTVTNTPPGAFAAKVNFQPAGVPIPAGYAPDTGDLYGARSGGLTYGWNVSNLNGVDRDAPSSPDQRYDTFNRMQAGGDKTWEIAVPNGTYTVNLVAGEAWIGGTYKIDVEGVRTIDGQQTSEAPWLSGSKTVIVNDGKLTVSVGAGGVGTKINFIEITQEPTGPATPAVTGVTLINSATDQDIGPLTNGMQINMATTGTELAIRAALAGVASGSLKFVLDGSYTRTENSAPYTLFGDEAGPNYLPGVLTAGSHQLIITPYSDADGTGTAGTPVTINFTIVNTPQTGFSTKINFQPANVPIPSGYQPDTGLVYGGRGNGLTYGWNTSNLNAIDRNAPEAPDQRYDTFNRMQNGGNQTWQIAVANGTYTVKVVAGDTWVGGVYKIDVEGVRTIDGQQTTANRFLTGTKTVNVTDGKLTVSVGAGASGTKINFIEIEKAAPAPQISALTLVNASTGQPVRTLVNGDVVNLDVVGNQLTVRAGIASGAVAGSVTFLLDGRILNLDNAVPFFAGGDNGTATFPLTPGFHTLTVIPYSQTFASGAAGTARTISFLVTPVEGTAAPITALDQKLPNVLNFAAQQLAGMANYFAGTGKFPQITLPNGNWNQVPATTWSSGLMAGTLWQMYQATGDSQWKQKATPFSNAMKGNVAFTEDTMFRAFAPLLPLFAETGDPALRAALLQAVANKSTQFDPDVQGFQTTWRKSSSGNPKANFGVLIDQLLDMELMLWGSKQTGNMTYYNQAVANARTVAANIVRADGSSAHWGYFDKDTGQLISLETAQGYSNNSTWARGQAWGIYGFAMMYRETGLTEFLTTAKKMADWYIANLPADKVPFWDFTDPNPNKIRDSSAASLAASGLLMISKLSSNPTDQQFYGAAAGEMLNSLTSAPYFAQGTTSKSILNKGAWYVPAPYNSPESGLIWGDYYFMEAINRYTGRLG